MQHILHQSEEPFHHAKNQQRQAKGSLSVHGYKYASKWLYIELMVLNRTILVQYLSNASESVLTKVAVIRVQSPTAKLNWHTTQTHNIQLDMNEMC